MRLLSVCGKCCDFNSHDQWHTVVAQSAIEDQKISDRVGCVRNFTLADGNHVREMLLSLSDKDYVSTYTIVEATVPLMRYVHGHAQTSDRRQQNLLALGLDL